MTDFDFRTQQQTFDRLGYARNPNVSSSSGAFVGNLKAVEKFGGSSIAELRNGGVSRKETKKLRMERMKGDGDLEQADGEGAYLGPWAGWKDEKIHVEGGVGPSEEERKKAEELSSNKKEEKKGLEEKKKREEEHGSERSTFHGEYERGFGIEEWRVGEVRGLRLMPLIVLFYLFFFSPIVSCREINVRLSRTYLYAYSNGYRYESSFGNWT